jgi:hypothetical protein
MPAAERYFVQRRGLLALWAGLLMPPLAWLLHLLIGYPLVPWACASGRQFMLHVVTAAAFLLAVGGGLTAWRSWQRSGRGWPNDAGGVLSRSRFMAVSGLLSSAVFGLVILAQGMPSFILHACEP